MSETQVEQETSTETKSNSTAGEIKLDGVFAHKLGMSSIYTEGGQFIPVTVLKIGSWQVTQIKTKEKDGYNAIQITTFGRRIDKTSKAEQSKNKKADLKEGAQTSREVRVDEIPDGISVGQVISLDSLAKGDIVKLTGTSKGRGFSGAMRRWNFAGGPASHGSKFHRRPGSAGTRTWPGLVLPGKRSPGHYGDETISIRNVQVVEVNTEDGLILVKGPVPGARNGLVRLLKQ